jgi:hypothetical protein
MTIPRASIAITVVVVCCNFCYAQSNPFISNAGSPQQPKADAKGTKAAPATSLTGCVDEQEGQWVLVSDQTMAVIAHLAADGFPTEGFAKHVGHKVTVRGTSSSDGSRPLFKVRTIEMISETCAAR